MALRNILGITKKLAQQSNINRTILIVPSRLSSYMSSERYAGIDRHPEVEVIRNPPEWKYVEQLLGKPTIPKPTVKSEYPSGWTPPDPARYKRLPYYIERTKNHMYPVFLHITFRGQRRITKVKYIEGDIWKLEADLHALIQQRVGWRVYSRINEMNRQILFKGDFVTLIQKHFAALGF